MLDKSPKYNIADNPSSAIERLGRCIPGIVLCSDAFEKIKFLDAMMNSTTYPAVIIDTDLLYTGYVESGMIPKRDDVKIFHPNEKDWIKEISYIISTASKTRTLVIIDSLNGLHGMFEDIESARFVNSSIMLLASLCRQTDGAVILTATARHGNTGPGWVLYPGGRHIIRSRWAGCYLLKNDNKDQLFLEQVNLDEIK